MMKDVPTSREGIIDSALLILHDWSHFIAVDYLVYTNEVVGNIMESYPCLLYTSRCV